MIDECKKYVVAGGKHEGSDRQFSSGSARLPLYFDAFVAAMESRGFLGFRYIEPTVLDFQSDLAAFGRSAVMQVGRVGRVGRSVCSVTNCSCHLVMRLSECRACLTFWGGGVLCEISASQAASPKQRRTPTGSGVAQDEVFGPIAPIARFKDIDEVVRFVNARYSWTHAAATSDPPA